jgi:hypothetical protein
MKYYFMLLLIVLANGCSKKDSAEPAGPGTNSPRPKTVSITYYAGSLLLQKSVYRPLYNGNILSAIDRQDTMFNRPTNYANTIYHTVLTLLFNDNNGTLMQVVSACKKSILVYAYPTGYGFTQEAPAYGTNFKALFSTVMKNGVSLTDVSIISYDDSVQQHAVQTVQFKTQLVMPAAGYFYSASAVNTLARPDDYIETKDSITFSTPTTGQAFSSGRYSEYYSTELPGYRPKSADIGLYSKLGAMKCDRFTLRNGNYNTVYLGNDTWGAVWEPSLERRIKYFYGPDSMAVHQLMSIINPGQSDPSWYYIAAYMKSGSGYWFSEGLDTKEIYDWTCSTASDSVFFYTGNIPSFKQASAVNNTTEKDNNGWLKKITHRVSSSSAYKVMEITY